MVSLSCDEFSQHRSLRLLTSRIFDPSLGDFVENKTIEVDVTAGLITAIYDTCDTKESDIAECIDLRNGQTVLPGFVDTHFLHPYAQTPWNDQVTKESIVERTLRAANHARETLLSGYTTVRDLGTEGALDSDIHFRDCLQKGIVHGPRLYCVTRGIVSTGSYGPKVGDKWDEGETQTGELPHGAEVANGVNECIKVVRRQVGAGADCIKIYGDYRSRLRIGLVDTETAARSFPLWTAEELETMIDLAHSFDLPVAVHADNAETISLSASLGVDTVEHGAMITDDALRLLSRQGTIWTPTLSVFWTFLRNAEMTVKTEMNRLEYTREQLSFPSDNDNLKFLLLSSSASLRSAQNVLQNALDKWNHITTAVKKGIEQKVKFSTGGDTGTFTHGTNSLELQLLVELGADWKDVLKWATEHGEEACRGVQRANWKENTHLGKEKGENAMRFGRLQPGYSADIIATVGDLEQDFKKAVLGSSIAFVMKAGKIYKLNGKSTI